MQKIILKSGKIDRYYTAMATIDKDSNGRYTAIVTLCDAKKYGKYVVSDIRISGKNKNVVLEQTRAIAKVFPPVKDINLLDVTEV